MPPTPVKNPARAGRASRIRNAFTLVELLTVIAIIGILAAIIIPVAANVRTKARAAKCVVTMRQWGIALRLYLQDSKDVFPKSAYGEPNLHTTFAPYLGMTGNPTPAELAKRGMGCTAEKWKHGFNAYLSSRPFSIVTQPSRHVYGIDLCSAVNDNRWLDTSVLGSKKTALTEAVPKPHQGRIGVLYVDGHAALKKVSEIMRAEVNRDLAGYVPADETTPVGSPAFDR
ncbi:MAG: prepilin-type N-terminal cleavage/methylation domain-containing protein [Opitutaceae bacterium]|jgi:prepilin-type N-terminal cleavage/methylation domain-containing protein/prepilin-type processing-associated H-X9-DG protein|nr:prepilin-type N-terminal cleavage/methylation domain-containing protein [Opitutaceae bacterium]